VAILADTAFNECQSKVLLCILRMNKKGVEILIQLAKNDWKGLKNIILNTLCSCNFVVENLIIPHLISSMTNHKHNKEILHSFMFALVRF